MFRDHPRVHFFRYANLRDLTGEMRRIAAVLEIETRDALLATLAEAASFSNMKANADRFVPGVSTGETTPASSTWGSAGSGARRCRTV